MTVALCRGAFRSVCLTDPRLSLIPAFALPSPALHRNCSSKSPQDEPKPKSNLSREQVRKNVNKYVFGRYIDHVKNYDKVLEKNFPSATRVYRVFFDGLKEFYADMKRFLKVAKIANGSPNGLKALNRKELELYEQMPKDMIKVAPALLISSLPFVGYAVFPIAFMYPRSFLTSHFWTLQQKCQFEQYYLLQRLGNNRMVFRCLQAKLSATKDSPLHPQVEQIFGLIGSGFHPTTEQLLAIKDFFAHKPFDYDSLTGKHVKYLCQLHGVRSGLFKRIRLFEHAFIVHAMDIAITREGGVHNMAPEALKRACYIRGLNPMNMSNEKMIDWLRQWVLISQSIEQEHISLFLHLPIFLAYNNPNNWTMIYGK